MQFVPEEILTVHESRFEMLGVRTRHTYAATMLEDPVAGKCLKFYILLTEFPEFFADRGVSAEQMFWTRYYWFLRFARLWQAGHGHYLGLAQTACQHPATG